MDLAFDYTISREVLCRYLSRAVTHGHAAESASVEDDVRMLDEIGALFIGRAAYVWKLSPDWDDDRHYESVRAFAAKVHARRPEAILQACVFEAVYPEVERIAVPDWVFEAFGLAPERRTFRFTPMVMPSSLTDHHWGRTGRVPDITSLETRMWFYYRACRYIDAGYEAIHLGQVHMYGARDEGYLVCRDVFDRIREYAHRKARRRLVLLDAHTHGVVIDGRMLFDWHSRPVSARAILQCPERIALMRKGESVGGVSPSGWRCDVGPYMIEVDNWGGYSLDPSQWTDTARRAAAGRWGYDDIAWLAHQTEEDRNGFLEYGHKFCRLMDESCYFQMPTRRTLDKAALSINGHHTEHYHANTASPACPHGGNQEATIRRLWNEADPRTLLPDPEPLPGGDVVAATGQRVNELVALVGSLQTMLGGVAGDSVDACSRMRHLGGGRFVRTAVIPCAGEHRFAISVGGTMTERYFGNGFTDGEPWRIDVPRDNTIVQIVFDYPSRKLQVRMA